MTEQHPDLGDPDQQAVHDAAMRASELMMAAPVKRGLVGEPALQLEEIELYKFMYLRAKAQTAQLLAEKYSQMARSAAGEVTRAGNELATLLDALGAKYQVDLHTHSITEDGKIVPNPQ